MESLYRKYRPLTFESVVGQQHIVSTLEHAVTEGRISHAYLFCGPRGTGKTTMARILAKALLCTRAEAARADGASGCMPDGTCEECRLIAEGSHPDVYELDAASRTGVDNVREEIINSVSFTPVRGAYKVYIIDEVHMLTTPAFNALLKTLEEPPEHVVFILCTTDPQKILETILSRCQRFDFHRIGNGDIVGRLRYICEQEGFEYDAEALEIVAKHARGGMRDALSTLEQLSVFGNGTVRVDDARSLLGEVSSAVLSQFGQAIAARDVATLFGLVRQQVDAGEDLMELTRDLVAHVRDIYMVRVAGARPELFDGADADVESLAAEARQFGTADRLARVLTVLDDAALEMRAAADTRLVLEIALTRLARPEADLTLEALAERLDRLEARMASGVPSAPLTAQGVAELTGRAADASASQPSRQSATAAVGSGVPATGARPDRPESGAPSGAPAHVERPWSATAQEHSARVPAGPVTVCGGDRQAGPASVDSARGGAGRASSQDAMRSAAQERAAAGEVPDAGAATAPAPADGAVQSASPTRAEAVAADRFAGAVAPDDRSIASRAAGAGAPAGPARDGAPIASNPERSRGDHPAGAAAPASQRSAVAIAASSAAATPAVTDPGDLQRKWAEVVQRAIKADPSRGSLLLSATVQSDDGSALTVNLPAGSGFAVAMLGRPDTQATVLPLVSAVFGARSVRYTMGGQASVSAAKAEEPARASGSAHGVSGNGGVAPTPPASVSNVPEVSASALGAASAPGSESAPEPMPSAAPGSTSAPGPAVDSASTSMPDFASMPGSTWDDEQVPYDDASAMAYDDDLPPFDMPDAAPGMPGAGFGAASKTPVASPAPTPSAAPAPFAAPSAPSPAEEASPASSASAAPVVPAAPNPLERMVPASSDASATNEVDVASVLGNVFGDGVRFFPAE